MAPIIESLEIAKTSAPLIILLGQTGAGKSHFINVLAGRQVARESAGLFSCTSKPELFEVKVDSNDFLLVDTPGFNDTWKDSSRSDARILSEIARILTLQSQMGVRLRGVLYLYDISVKRMTGDTLRQFEIIKRVCGKKNFGNVILVTTQWPSTPEEQRARGCAIREGDLRRDFWNDMIEGGSIMRRFSNDQGTARTIVRSLAGKADVTLALQEEMANGTGLTGSCAGAYLITARKSDEASLRALGKECEVDEDAEALAEDVRQLKQSVRVRRADEGRLDDDIVERIRSEIQAVEKEAKARRRKPTVANVISWLIGISSLTVGIVRTIFAANN